MRTSGFSMLEMMISMSILSVVALLGFTVITGSYETSALANAKAEVQSDLRNVINAITSEIELAHAEPAADTVESPEGVTPIRASADGRTLMFQRVVPNTAAGTYTWSGLITFQFETEDLGAAEGGANALLDDGEDANGDGVLNRRITRTEGGASTTLASANTISNVTFELLPNIAEGDDRLTTLRVRVAGSKRYGPGLESLLREEMESRITILN